MSCLAPKSDDVFLIFDLVTRAESVDHFFLDFCTIEAMKSPECRLPPLALPSEPVLLFRLN